MGKVVQRLVIPKRTPYSTDAKITQASRKTRNRKWIPWFGLLVGNLSSTSSSMLENLEEISMDFWFPKVYPQIYPDRNQESLYDTNPNTAFWIASQIIQNVQSLAASPQRWVPFNNPSKKPYANSQFLTLLKTNMHSPWKWMVGRLLSLWEGRFSEGNGRIIPVVSNPHLSAMKRPFGRGPTTLSLWRLTITMVMNDLRSPIQSMGLVYISHTFRWFLWGFHLP